MTPIAHALKSKGNSFFGDEKILAEKTKSEVNTNGRGVAAWPMEIKARYLTHKHSQKSVTALKIITSVYRWLACSISLWSEALRWLNKLNLLMGETESTIIFPGSLMLSGDSEK